MAGKAYTMREMRDIVEYLNERKAYSELRGRKMWMEYANSDKTTRTWQSLKETFLKRILPDIQNPYYKLTMDQARSFKQGFDVVEKEKNNQLEFRAEIQNETSSKQNEEPTTSRNNEVQTSNIGNDAPTISIDDELGKATGESITAAKIPSRCRSSVETIVLDTYESAEDIQRALESPINEEPEGKSKSLKDMLTFEPITPAIPVVANLLGDFETDSENSDREPQLNVLENPPIIDITDFEPVLENDEIENLPSENDIINNEADSTIEIKDSENINTDAQHIEKETPAGKEISIDTTSHNDKENNVLIKDNSQGNNTKTLEHSEQNSKRDNEVAHVEYITADFNTEAHGKSSGDPKNTEINNTIANTENSTQNTGNMSSDTLLPNNQEALNNSKKEQQKTSNNKTEETIIIAKPAAKKVEKKSVSTDSKEQMKRKFANDKPKDITNAETSTIMVEIPDTPTEQNTASILLKNTVTANTPIIENTTNKTEQFDVLKEISSEKAIKPVIEMASNKTVQLDVLEENPPEKAIKSVITKERKVRDTEKEKVIAEDINPCLMSVSLFEDQFCNTKYSSDSDVVIISAPEQIQAVDKTQKAVVKQTEEKTNLDDNPQELYDNEDGEVTKQKKVVAAIFEDKETDILDSSENKESQSQEVVNHTKHANKSVNLQRERALANVFGFAHGAGATTSRKRQSSRRRKSHHRHQRRRRSSVTESSNTSEWTSESDSESYVSATRGRRRNRKYVKPLSSRIVRDPEDGALYALFGKNSYPVVKGGKFVKNFVNLHHGRSEEEEVFWRHKYEEEERRAKENIKYTSSSPSSKQPQNNQKSRDSAVEESYWKQKFEEEQQKVEKIKKLLQLSQAQLDTQAEKNKHSSDISQLIPQNNATSLASKQPQINENKALAPAVEAAIQTEPKEDKMVLKIAAKNGVEYCLEGGWNQISNVMPQVVKMLQYDTTDTNKGKSKPVPHGTVQRPTKTELDMDITSSSSETTPIPRTPHDPVHEKVNKIESEIFDKIEAMDKDETKQKVTESTNVTLRKARISRKESSSSSVVSTYLNPAKKPRTSKTDSTDSTNAAKGKSVSKTKFNTPKEANIDKPSTQIITVENDSDIEHKESTPNKRRKNKIDVTEKRTSSRISRQSEQKSDAITSVRQDTTPKKIEKGVPPNDIQLRGIKSTKETEVLEDSDEEVKYKFPPTGSAKTNKLKTKKKYKSLPAINIIPPQEMSGHSINSTQGYLDSNPSPLKNFLPKRKRKVSYTARKKNNRCSFRRRSCQLLQTVSSDSNQSSYFVPLRRSLSRLNSESCRSDSFHLSGVPSHHLERIDEINGQTHEFDSDIRHFSSVSKGEKNSRSHAELGSSSNVSLPVSPELSVVENLSISRELIKGDNHLTINEFQQNKSSGPMDYSDFIISNLDVSVPLMNQQCSIQKNTDNATSAMSVDKTDLVQVKDCTVNVTLSETLDQRLRDLLLESAKKMSRVETNQEAPMEIDQTLIVPAKKTRLRNRKINVDMAMDVDQSNINTSKKTKAPKRSSTPRKKKAVPKANGQQKPIIEEHTESCSYAGRNSCPPSIKIVPIDENACNCSDVALPEKGKSKKKKDIIKVKIRRPNKRQPMETLSEKSDDNARGSAASNCTDSGIIDVESTQLLKDFEDSVELIHNHSETCLLANECLGSTSVELLENSLSIISVTSSRQSEDFALDEMSENHLALSEQMFGNSVTFTPDKKTPEGDIKTSHAAYHCTSVLSNSSLITEDLSNSPPIQRSKWYLLDEDITNIESTSNIPSFGSNLKQIFPIACAVPNLSTISEMSKENEDSRKTNSDSQK